MVMLVYQRVYLLLVVAVVFAGPHLVSCTVVRTSVRTLTTQKWWAFLQVQLWIQNPVILYIKVPLHIDIYICIYIYTSIYISDYGFIPHRTRYSSEFPIRIRFPFWCPFFCSWPRLPLELSAQSCHCCDVPGPADFWDFIKDFMVILWYPLAI